MTTAFAERVEHLRDLTGSRERTLRGSVTVDQVYAHYQHEHLEFRHPRGGEAKFLERPLMDNYRLYLQDYARSVLDESDGGLRSVERSMEHLSDMVELRAPREFFDLARSGHPQVELGGRSIYDRQPHVHRLTEAELRIKSRIRYMALPDRLKGWIWWHVQHHTEPPPRRRR
jgi:hypothetical protein